MPYSKVVVFVAAGFAVGASVAHAGLTANAVVTADNHYAIYTGDTVNGITQIGRNELGSAGSPGTYNWSLPETWDFSVGTYVYIAAWSDDSIAQGLLAALNISDGSTLHSGNLAWEVMFTDTDLDDGSAEPSVAQIGFFSDLADTNALWTVPTVGGTNGSNPAPWGTVPGVDASAAWMWGNPSNVANPFDPGADHREFQLFRVRVTQVPAPTACAAVLLGGMVILRRRR